jgi:hypothetical protein
MISANDLLNMRSDWEQRLTASPRYRFDDLRQLRKELAAPGVYVIWFQLKMETGLRCLKIGKAQRAGNNSLHARLLEHWGSRGKGEKHGPNVLAQHLMEDEELADLTGLNLRDCPGRKRLLEELCSFQAWPFRVQVPPRQVAILESFLEVILSPRYVGKCGGYGGLIDPDGEFTAGWQFVPKK